MERARCNPPEHAVVLRKGCGPVMQRSSLPGGETVVDGAAGRYDGFVLVDAHV